jgi:hypothetical protein
VVGLVGEELGGAMCLSLYLMGDFMRGEMGGWVVNVLGCIACLSAGIDLSVFEGGHAGGSAIVKVGFLLLFMGRETQVGRL